MPGAVNDFPSEAKREYGRNCDSLRDNFFSELLLNRSNFALSHAQGWALRLQLALGNFPVEDFALGSSLAFDESRFL